MDYIILVFQHIDVSYISLIKGWGKTFKINDEHLGID